MHVIDFIVFIAFTLGVVVFGCSFFKKGSSADEFTSAGHSIPGWVVGMSIFMPLSSRSPSLLRAISQPSISCRSIAIVVLFRPIPSWRRSLARGLACMPLPVIS